MTGRAWGVIFLLVGGILGGTAVWLRCEGAPPEFQTPEAVVSGAEAQAVLVSVRDPGSGVRTARATLRHAGGEATVFEQELIGNPLVGGARPHGWEELRIEFDPKALGVPHGDAFLVVEATDWSWQRFGNGNVAQTEIPVSVDLTVPSTSVLNGLTYVQRAGSATVHYQLSEETTRDGVLVDDVLYQGRPMPNGGPLERVAIFAIPRDAKAAVEVQMLAEDAAGNQSLEPWPARVRERSFDDVRLNLSDGFMNGKVASLAKQLGLPTDDLVATFQEINQGERARNEKRIREIVAASADEPLFEGRFVQMRNSAVTSRFAEHRSYYLNDRKISEAIHYGYDLASFAGAPIEAAGAGRVLFADELGIYGKCVILDHGMGLTSLYAHLSSIAVKEGDTVEKRGVLGRSGATGLAGGDHLHFAMLVGDTYVDPKEWWDGKWVRDHVAVRLPQVLPNDGE